jgi:hypothetical protein
VLDDLLEAWRTNHRITLYLIGAVESSLAGVLSGEPKRRGFKKGIFTTLSYLIAHESHHRGSILLTLKTSGHTLDKKATYAIWSWDQM